ncbi:MAG TPA: PQQ-dependent sugar dehydrogenase [Candidatus Paceibacterota bacterium]|nr:PQQ-dependent sugar dehydrogenase [Candidatus Paceibacterota bacterium]
MKKIALFALLVLIVLAGVAWWYLQQPNQTTLQQPALVESTREANTTPDIPRHEIIAENLTIPWEILFLPDGEILITERPGRLVLLNAGVTLEVPGIQHIGEGGLLGAALHPRFERNQYLYLFQTTDDGAGLLNRIVRYILEDNTLTFDRVILDNLPGARYHDGGRLAFGPDGYLYATVGDALRPAEAQNPDSLEGTIIRLTDEGEPAPENPFNSYVYSYGHRNAQGLAWDGDGNLWSSEHGRSVGGSGFDEINYIRPGANYGWPDSQGDTVAMNTVAPVRHSTADVTWAPGDIEYLDGRLFMSGLRGETVYVAQLDDTNIRGWLEVFVGDFGRLRTIAAGPDGLLYLLTSNQDGRGSATAGDDKLIRINPAKVR